jgi:hypothetical protein
VQGLDFIFFSLFYLSRLLYFCCFLAYSSHSNVCRQVRFWPNHLVLNPVTLTPAVASKRVILWYDSYSIRSIHSSSFVCIFIFRFSRRAIWWTQDHALSSKSQSTPTLGTLSLTSLAPHWRHSVWQSCLCYSVYVHLYGNVCVEMSLLLLTLFFVSFLFVWLRIDLYFSLVLRG